MAFYAVLAALLFYARGRRGTSKEDIFEDDEMPLDDALFGEDEDDDLPPPVRAEEDEDDELELLDELDDL